MTAAKDQGLDVERMREALKKAKDSVVEMATYNDVPGARNDLVWRGIWERGADTLRAIDTALLSPERSAARSEHPPAAAGDDSGVYEAPRDPNHKIRVRGVGRDAAEPRSLSLALTERPTDDEMRALHDFFSQRPMLDAVACFILETRPWSRKPSDAARDGVKREARNEPPSSPSDLVKALEEIERLRLATDEGTLRVRADRMWEICTAALRSHRGEKE